ncbi:MAG: funZ protein [Thermodesulfobacteriota bacterium]
MKMVNDLELGFSDAENYRRRENKSLLNRVFIRNHNLDRLCDPAISFLIGEKGTGKTAYAVYLANNDYLETLSSLRYIRETEYQKFIALKNEKHLGLSDYSSIWKVIIYLLLAQQIIDREGGIEFLRRFTKLGAVQNAIDEYYHKAFSPEIVQALNFVQESKIAAELMAKHAKTTGEERDTLTFSETRFQTNLFYIQNSFQDAFRQVRLNKNHLLFIDGIDIRPASIPYEEYLLCIKGLANAVWEVNNDFFPSIKGGCGRMRTVLLIRPDIFQSIGLQNQNTKIRDNSVFLDWRTEYTNHRKSDLFKVIDHLLSSQQAETLKDGDAWDYYFPWDAPNVMERFKFHSSFIGFLRWSYYRPRDIVTMLSILQEISRQTSREKTCIEYSEFDNAEFKRAYSEYLLGEIKDHLTFYYGEEEYNLFLKFFKHLNGKNKFSYEEYIVIYSDFRKSIASSSAVIPKFMSTSGDFLQFLYDLNVLSYIEYPVDDKPYIRWCFRQRSYGDINPKVKEGCDYQVFYGLYKALNVGQEFRR